MNKFCKQCGAALHSEVQFCASCGTKIQDSQTPQTTTLTMGADRTASKVNKRKLPPMKPLIIAVAVVLVFSLGIAILPRMSGEPRKYEETTSDLSIFNYSEQDYLTKAKKVEVSPEHPSASAYGVNVEFGEFALEREETLEIRELPEKVHKKDGVKLTAYDLNLGEQSEFDDVITITIPYDVEYAEEGAESECVGAKYYNQVTGEWEGVYYVVDTANRQVLIYTTHLSTYGVYQVKNKNTRKAYITDVYAIVGLLNTGKSFEVLKEFAETGQTGNAAFEAGLEAVNYVVGNTGTGITAITMGGQYDGALVKALGDGSQHLGLAMAAVQTYYDFTYNFSDDQGKLNTLANLSKNIANNAVGYFGSSALQTGFAAIAVFDMILSTVQSDMMELKLENLGGVYQYYNDVEAPRSAKEWRSIFIKILRDNSNDPAAAQKLIESEINSFCDRFWSLDYGKVKEIAGVSGLRYSFDERHWTKDREVLSAQYREHLMARLQAPLTSARSYLLKQAQEQARKELEKQLKALQNELNKNVQVQIIEQPEKAGEYKYDGYTVQFAPLLGNANVKNWSGKMPKGGEMNTSFTILGHMQSGSPNTLELFPPGKESPELTVGFKVSYPITTIYISSQVAEEQEEVDVPSQGEQTDISVSEKEYAWVLVDTVHRDMQYDIEHANKEGVYEKSASASSGSYTYSQKYLGDSDDYYNPPTLHGESYATQLIFSVPPEVIRGGETVSLSFNLTFTDTNLSFFHGNGSARADWDNLRFVNADGKSFFEIFYSIKYSEKNILSVSDTLSAVIPAGYSEGERRELWTGGYTGTYYVYEWRPIS